MLNISQIPEVKEKKKQTYLKHYGVDNYVKTKEYLVKTQKTSIEKYGTKHPSSSFLATQKRRLTCLEKYGVEVAASSDIVQDKVKQTNLERYGCECVFSNENIKEKIKETLCQHGNIKTSKIQYKLYETLFNMGYEVELNYRVGKYSLDIALFYCGKQIDIEYDGQYWHQDVSKDMKRNEYLINKGWSVIRIKSNNLLPDENYLNSVIHRVICENITLDILYLKDWNYLFKNKEEK